MFRTFLFLMAAFCQSICSAQNLHIGISGGLTPITAANELTQYRLHPQYESLPPVNRTVKLFLSFRNFETGIGFETGHLTARGTILKHQSIAGSLDRFSPVISAPYYVPNLFVNGRIKLAEAISLYGGIMGGYNFRAYRHTTIVAQLDTAQFMSPGSILRPIIPMNVTEGGITWGLQAGIRGYMTKRLSVQVEAAARSIIYKAVGSSPWVSPSPYFIFTPHNDMTYNVWCYPVSIGVNWSFSDK